MNTRTSTLIDKEEAVIGRHRRGGDITDQEFEEIVQVMQPPAEDERPLVFRFGEDLEAWVQRLAGDLARG